MKVLIVYDSLYGNTEKIAGAIGSGIAGEVKVVRANEAGTPELESIDLLIIGSPTNGGRPTQPVQDFLGKIPESVIRKIKLAAFDTRITGKLIGIFGFAAGRIAESLKMRGGTLVAPGEGFYVKGSKGPLKEGEFERASGWAKDIAK